MIERGNVWKEAMPKYVVKNKNVTTSCNGRLEKSKKGVGKNKTITASCEGRLWSTKKQLYNIELRFIVLNYI